MTVTITANRGVQQKPSWPQYLAYLAAGLFTGASGITNLLYGIAKGSDFGTSLVWGAVSIGVSIIFALSWPALLLSIDRKQWSRATMAFVALLLTGTYSVSAALGSAMGGRANAAIEQRDKDDNRGKVQATYDTAKTELTSIKPARPVAELEALLAAARPQCRIVVTLSRRDTVCSPPPSLVAELGRAKRRAELEIKIERAAGELATTGPAKLANSDAVALSVYLQGLGLTIDADRVNKLLVLLAVLVIECGGGPALAVGMALSDAGLHGDQEARCERGAANGAAVGSATPLAVEKAQASKTPAVLGASDAAGGSQLGEASARVRLLQMVVDAAGVLRTSERALGSKLSVSSTRARRLLSELAVAGAIKVRTSRAGTTITLIEGGRA